MISRPRMTREIDAEVRAGDIAYQLIRPYDYVLFRLAGYLAERLLRLGDLPGDRDGPGAAVRRADPARRRRSLAAAALVLALGMLVDFGGVDRDRALRVLGRGHPAADAALRSRDHAARRHAAAARAVPRVAGRPSGRAAVPAPALRAGAGWSSPAIWRRCPSRSPSSSLTLVAVAGLVWLVIRQADARACTRTGAAGSTELRFVWAYVRANLKVALEYRFAFWANVAGDVPERRDVGRVLGGLLHALSGRFGATTCAT